MSALGALLERLPHTTLVVGKGGVGKTTCAAAIAAAFAERGESTLLVSTDPAAALSAVLESPVGGEAAPVPRRPRLHGRQLVAADLRRAFLAEWRETIAEIIDRGTYLDRDDIDGLVDAALPGADEIFALLALADLIAAPGEWRRLVVDTAPTGHTLRLLVLPETFRALVSMLESMQAKHRFMVRALTHRYRADRPDEFLREMERRIDTLRASLADSRSLAAVLITRAEPVVVAETQRYVEALHDLHIAVAATIVNAVAADIDTPEREAITTLKTMAGAGPLFWIPHGRHKATADFKGSLNFLGGLDERPTKPRRFIDSDPLNVGSFNDSDPLIPVRFPIPNLRTLTILGGKGGVGKTTVACALAINAADAQLGNVLLVSTDPAPSIADALGERDARWTGGDDEREVAGVRGLVARQIDAAAAFARFRDAYQAKIDALFDAVLTRGMDVAYDRAILRDLLSLAPPGVDELYALSILGETLEAGRFTCIVVDPAPTGHLLRLLEMPALALDWSHRLMRLMLKYRDVTGLGDAAQELLNFARRTRTLDALLRDPSRAGVILVALDEPVVRQESERLTIELHARGIDLISVIWNRADRASLASVMPLPVKADVSQVLAVATTPAPIGASALREWLGTWQRMNATS